MSERTPMAHQASIDLISATAEARLLLCILKAFGVNVAIRQDNGEPFFGFPAGTTKDVREIAALAEDRFRAKTEFAEAFKLFATAAPVSVEAANTPGIGHAAIGNAAPIQTEASVPAGVAPEAETLIGLLSEMGLTPAVTLGFGSRERILFEIEEHAASGAIDVAKIVSKRFDTEADYRDDVIAAVGVFGHYLTDAPGISSDLKSGPAHDLIAAVRSAGFSPHLLQKGEGSHALVYGSFNDAVRDLAAIDLVRLLEQRFEAEPEFRSRVVTILDAEEPRLSFAG